MQSKEKETIESMLQSLTDRRRRSFREHEVESSVAREKSLTLSETMRDVQTALKTKREVFSKVERSFTPNPSKRACDAMKENIALNRRIIMLQKTLSREEWERDLADQELAHVKLEIQRAEAMIERFKESLTKDQQIAADSVNDNLKLSIEEQREDFKRSIANQRRRNLELEKQKTELAEEEKMLSGFLLTLEKQLQVQAQKLPSLAQLQHRLDGPARGRRTPLPKPRRMPDDLEMRNIKKAIVQVKSQKKSKSVMIGSRYADL
jgi:hypothetical protein